MTYFHFIVIDPVFAPETTLPVNTSREQRVARALMDSYGVAECAVFSAAEDDMDGFVPENTDTGITFYAR